MLVIRAQIRRWGWGLRLFAMVLTVDSSGMALTDIQQMMADVCVKPQSQFEL